tara:strand:- start:150 stop:806 length:657 start_codon:yes stop_codon:yes gene_type:complete
MKQKLGMITVGLLLTANLFAQKASYYKDKSFRKETSEKKAKFKKTEFYKGDTLVIQSRRIFDNLVLEESKWIENKAVGTWTKHDLKGKLISSRNFGVLIYSNEPIDGVYDNTKENDGCTNCELATYSTGESGMFQFMATNISYPSESKDKGSSGSVYIRFMIDKEGNTTPHSIMKGVDPFLDLETWQLIEKMTKWNPATKNGSPIESYWSLPVRFTLR